MNLTIPDARGSVENIESGKFCRLGGDEEREAKRKVTWVDWSLPHQVILRNHGSYVSVSCNCRENQNPFGMIGRPRSNIMGLSKNIDDTKAIYNDSSNHKNHPVPFTDEHKLTYPDSTDVRP